MTISNQQPVSPEERAALASNDAAKLAVLGNERLENDPKDPVGHLLMGAAAENYAAAIQHLSYAYLLSSNRFFMLDVAAVIAQTALRHGDPDLAEIVAVKAMSEPGSRGEVFSAILEKVRGGAYRRSCWSPCPNRARDT